MELNERDVGAVGKIVSNQSLSSRASTESRVRKARLSKSLPAPYTGGNVYKKYKVEDFPDTQSLKKALTDWGIDVEQWGRGDAKNLCDFLQEMKHSEAGFEVWLMPGGRHTAVRVTHVLRAKVASPGSYDNNCFLFNTKQQNREGRTRCRNGLLSKKLQVSEMPLVEHLQQVCERAVTSAELRCVVDSAVRIRGGRLPSQHKQYDPCARSNATVERAIFVDHTVEFADSKSYPGLLTMYNLYTVDIVCTGLPVVDFNSLEYETSDVDSARPLKYIHTWVWLDWATITRYLFEGSEMKARKGKGAFASPVDLGDWLQQFDLDLDVWGTERWDPIDKLWGELEQYQAQLEMWGRHDGVPLLMRVVHVLQLKVTSPDAEKENKFLFQTWQQSPSGFVRETNRFLAKKLKTHALPFNEEKFEAAARHIVAQELSHLSEVHVRLNNSNLPKGAIEHNLPPLQVRRVCFADHRYDIEESTTFKDLLTMYHIYTVEVQVENLPSADFASIVYDYQGVPSAIGWKWVTWQQTQDIIHKHVAMHERQAASMKEALDANSKKCADCLDQLRRASLHNPGVSGPIQRLREVLKVLDTEDQRSSTLNVDRVNSLPPSMLASMVENKGVSDEFIDNALRRLHVQRSSDALEPPAPPVKAPEEDLVKVEDTQEPRRLWCWSCAA